MKVSIPKPATALLLIFSCSAALAATEYSYKKASGPYQIAKIDELLLNDATRGKKVPVKIRAPRVTSISAARFPMVVFSHGAGGSKEAFPNLCDHWASHGYVVVNPTHSDSVQLRRKQGEVFNPIDPNLKAKIIDRVSILDRRADVRLILDSIPVIEKAIAGVGSTLNIDKSNLAMAGHSAGAMTTQALAGVRFYPKRSPKPICLPETRFKAYILISGQGLTRPSFHKDSWSGITKPMMVLAGSEDRSPVNDETPEGRRHPYEYAPAGDKYLVYIEGATHSSYSGKTSSRMMGETPPKNIGYITDITAFSTLAFLDCYLKTDSGARKYLDSDSLMNYPGGKVEYLRK